MTSVKPGGKQQRSSQSRDFHRYLSYIWSVSRDSVIVASFNQMLSFLCHWTLQNSPLILKKWSQQIILCMLCQITQGAHMEDTTLLTVNTQSAKIGTLSMTHGWTLSHLQECEGVKHTSFFMRELTPSRHCDAELEIDWIHTCILNFGRQSPWVLHETSTLLLSNLKSVFCSFFYFYEMMFLNLNPKCFWNLHYLQCKHSISPGIVKSYFTLL